MSSFLLLEECHEIGGFQYERFIIEGHLNDLQNCFYDC